MAKKATALKSVPLGGVNKVLLSGIKSGDVTHVSQEDAMPHLAHNPALIEVNTSPDVIVDGKAPVRLTDAGHKLLEAEMPKTVTQPSMFDIIKGAEIPVSKRGNHKGAGAPTVYPFEQMEVGDSFFVPVSEKHPDPLKSLGSTVSAANMRFAEETGEKKVVTRTKRGEKNKAMLDSAGNKVKETVEVPVYKHTRKFVIRGVEAGKQYGSFTAPDHGALIARVPVE